MASQYACRRLSRRRFIELGAGVAATTFIAGPAAGQADAATRQGSGRRYFSRVARVTHLTGHNLHATAITIEQALSAPIFGFPADAKPRVGDLVVITDSVPGYPLAALPVCRWHTGRVSQLTTTTFAIDGTPALNSPMLPTSMHGQTLKVCLLETSLAEHLVLGVRPAIS